MNNVIALKQVGRTANTANMTVFENEGKSSIKAGCNHLKREGEAFVQVHILIGFRAANAPSTKVRIRHTEVPVVELVRIEIINYPRISVIKRLPAGTDLPTLVSGSNVTGCFSHDRISRTIETIISVLMAIPPSQVYQARAHL